VAISSDGIGLLFRAKGDTDDAKKAFSDLRSHVNTEVDNITGKGSAKFTELSKSIGLSETSAKSLAGALGPVTVAIAAGVAVMAAEITIAIRLTEGLFSLAKSASEAGSKIKDMQDKTGLAAPLLSTLSVNAEQAGSSLDQVGGGLVKFAKGIGEANAGNEKAQANMKALGVTSTDLDTALKQAVKTIANAKDGTEQINLAIKAFGKSGADLIPVIKQMNGDLEAAQKEAERLGLTLSDKDAAAADAFGDTLDTLSKQVSMISERFALEFAPAITHAMSEAIEWIAKNQDVIRDWSVFTATAIADVIRGMESVASTVGSVMSTISGWLSTNGQSWVNWKQVVLTSVLALLGPLGLVLDTLRRIGHETGKGSQGTQEGGGHVTALPNLSTTGGSGKGGGGGKSDAAQKADADLKAQLDLQKLYLKDLEDAYKASMAKVREAFKKDSNSDTFIADAKKANKEFVEGLPAVLDAIDTLEKKLLKDPTENQAKLLDKQQAERREQIEKMRKDDLEKNADLTEKFDEKRAESAKKSLKEIADFSQKTTDQIHDNLEKNADAEIKAALKHYDEISKADNTTKKQREAAYAELSQVLSRNYVALTIEENAFYENQKINLDAWKKKKEDEINETIKDEETRKAKLEEVNAEYERRLKLLNDIHDQEKQNIEQRTALPVDDAEPGFIDTIAAGMAKGANAVNTMQGVLQTFGGIALDVFNQVGQAVGQMVANFVLMGSAGTSFRKFVATILASVAQQAATLAVMCLAYAALASTVIGAILLGGTPHQFLIAAAMFGAVAAGAAIAGRLVAGDSFKQQSVGERSFAQSAGSSTTDQRGKAGVYSGQKDQIIEAGRNAPGENGIPPVQVQLHLKLDSNGVLEIIKDSVRTNGIMRDLIIEHS
jgi:hypothetical protein